MRTPVKVPESTIARLSLYRRELDRLAEAGRTTISSFELARELALSAAQIRRDLHYFGQFGKAGRGYDVDPLRKVLCNVLGVSNRMWRAGLVGVGNLGRALLSYPGFSQQGFKIVIAFDQDPRKIGDRINGLRVEDSQRLKERLHQEPIDIGIIAVPASAAIEVGQLLCQAGVRAILNFSPRSIHAPSSVQMRHVDLSRELEYLSFHLSHGSWEPHA